jgi:hypothetical protein
VRVERNRQLGTWYRHRLGEFKRGRPNQRDPGKVWEVEVVWDEAAVGDPARVGLLPIVYSVVGSDACVCLSGRRLRTDALYVWQTLVGLISDYTGAQTTSPIDTLLGAKRLIGGNRLIGDHATPGISEEPAAYERI